MRLLSYIKMSADSTVRRGTSSQNDYGKCLRSVSMYLGEDNDADINVLIDEDFVLGYGRYLFGGQYAADSKSADEGGEDGVNFSRRTLEKHFAALRTLARHAITGGLVPGVDAFPAALRTLNKEFGCEEKGRDARYYAPTAHSFDKEVLRMASAVSAGLNSKSKAPQARMGLLYLLGLYTCGLEPGFLAELPAGTTEVNHPRLGVKVMFSPVVMEIVKLYNGNRKSDDWLLHRTADFDVSAVATAMTRYVDGLGVELYRSRSVFSDWLALGVEAGVLPLLISKVANGRGTLSASDIATINKRAVAGSAILLKRWYVLCSYSASMRSDKLRGVLEQYIKDEGLAITPRRDLYDPQYIRKVNIGGKMVKRNSPIVSRFLFVRCTLDTARRIDGFHRNASMLRRAGDRTQFDNVPESQIVRLIEFLQDFREEVELVDMTTWAREHRVNLEEGTQVRILNGPLKGQEGVIVTVKRSTSKLAEDHRVFTVNVAAGVYAVTATLEGMALEPVNKVIA